MTSCLLRTNQMSNRMIGMGKAHVMQMYGSLRVGLVSCWFGRERRGYSVRIKYLVFY